MTKLTAENLNAAIVINANPALFQVTSTRIHHLTVPAMPYIYIYHHCRIYRGLKL